MTKSVIEDVATELTIIINEQSERCQVAGSLRRNEDHPDDLDFVIIPKEGETIENIKFPEEHVSEIRWSGDRKKQFVYKGLTIDLFATDDESWGATLMFATGGKWFNIAMRQKAKARGMLLNQYGLYNRDTGEYLAGRTENEIFDELEYDYVEPFDRK